MQEVNSASTARHCLGRSISGGCALSSQILTLSWNLITVLNNGKNMWSNTSRNAVKPSKHGCICVWSGILQQGLIKNNYENIFPLFCIDSQ